MGDGRQYYPWIHLDDIIGIFEVKEEAAKSLDEPRGIDNSFTL